MIKHVVMLKFKPEVSQEQQAEAAKKMGGAVAKIPGVKNITMGQALALEGEPAYQGATFIDFDDEVQLKAYLNDPRDKAVAAQLQTMCSDILVMDYLLLT